MDMVWHPANRQYLAAKLSGFLFDASVDLSLDFRRHKRLTASRSPDQM
jgi:hypothetical protein